MWLCEGSMGRDSADVRKMLQYAREHHLELEGYAYEMGMNDLVIQDEGEFLTRILIKLKELI